MGELKEILSKIGMDETELKVYETIVAFGFHTAGQVSSKTEIPYEDVSEALQSLESKNYLKKKEIQSKEGAIFIPLAPKIAISSDLSQSLSDRLKSLSTKISEIWSNAEQRIDQDTQQLINEVKTLLDEYATKIEQLLANNKGSIETWSENSVFTLNETTNESVDEFKDTVTDPLNDIAQKMVQLSEQIKQESSSNISEIEAKTETHQASIEAAVEQIKNELGEFAEEVGFILSGRISGLNAIIEDLSGQASEQSDQITSTMRQSFGEMKNTELNSFKTINSDFVSNSLNAYSSTTDQLQQQNQGYQSQFEGIIDQTIQANSAIKDKTVESSKELLTEYDSRQIQSVTELQTQFNEAINTVQENAVEELGQILNSTSGKLSEMKIDIGSNLNQFQHDLSEKLGQLTNQVEQNLNQRFGEIETLLSDFVGNLKDSTKNNVNQTSASVMEIKEFLQSFLTEIQDSLDEQLQQLSTSVGSNLNKIVTDSNANIDEAVNTGKSRLGEINFELNEKIEQFQHSVNDFLRTAKSDLKNRLTIAQEKFKDGVEQGVSAYQSESQRIHELQADQMNEIRDEVNNLSKEAEKAREDASNVVNVKLSEIKTESIEQLNDRISSDVDKISRELSRFNERLDRDLRRFYEDFHDNTVKIREDVPNSIENMFLGQTNQLEGIRRQFDSNKRFIQEFFESIEQDMQPGEKVWKKKDFQSEFYERAQRIRSDFARFQAEFERYFQFALEDTEDVKNEVLAGFNKIIQDEVVTLEDLVESESGQASKITKEFVGSLDQQKSNLKTDMAASIDDTISEVTSKIRKNLLMKFEQPLESIISKAQAVATGTEGVDQENRIIKAQNLLIDKINEAVDELVVSLQSAFQESVEDLDNKVEQSIQQSQNIVSTLTSDIDDAFTDQSSAIDNFATTVKGEISGVQEQVNNQLSSTVDTTKSTVATTFDEKGSEVEDTVSSKTNELSEAMNAKLGEVDQSLDQFKANLTQIKDDTVAEVNTTVDQSISAQKESLSTTLDGLGQATEQAKSAIDGTKSSLDSNVDATLSDINKSVIQLVASYTSQLEDLQNELTGKIATFYESEGQVETLSSLNDQMQASITEYLGQITAIQEGLQKELKTKVDELQQSHHEHFDDYANTLNSKLDELAESNSNFILDLFDQISTQLSSVQAEVLGSIENAKNNIDNTVTNSIETVRTDILHPANEVVNAVSDSATEYGDKLVSLSKEFSGMATKEDSVIESARSRLLERLTAGIEQETQSWLERGENIYGDQSSTLHGMASEFGTKVNKATSQGQQAVSSEIEKIPDVIEDTLDAASRSMTLLNQISEGAIELDPQLADTSYFDVGEEAIKTNLNAILSRTKSSVTIVSPTISWLDPDIIPSFTRATVRIVVDPDKLTEDDQQIIDRFAQHNVSVSLRKLDRNRYRRDLDMIMATRDREEVILSKILSTENPYAFVSQDDYFIDKFAELFGIFQTMPEYK